MDIQVKVATDSGSAQRDEEAARALMIELDSIPHVATSIASGPPPPPGAKSIEMSVAELVIGLGGGALLPTVIGVLRDWLMRQPPSTKLAIRDGDFEFQWEGSTPPQQVNDFMTRLIERHKG